MALRLLSCLFLLSFTQTIFSQQDLVDENGDVFEVSGKFKLNNTPDHPENNPLTLEAGDAVEGDYIGQMAFTPDGEHVLVPHRTTHNVSVIEWESGDVVMDIPVGGQPLEIIANDSFALAPCYNDDALYIIRLSDYSVAAVIPTASQPSKVRISTDGSIGAVACDEGDALEVIDLSTLTKITTIQNFTNYLYKFSFITSNTRNTVYWSGFELSNDGSVAVVGAETGLQFYDTQTGNLLEEITEVTDAGMLGLSGDGERVVTIKTGQPGEVCLVDMDSMYLVNKIDISEFVSSPYSRVAVNQTGSRAFAPGSSGNSYLVRFDQNNYQPVNTTSTPNWMGVSADRQFALFGQYYFTMVSFATGNVVSQLQGRPIQNGIMAPNNNRIVACDPLRFEGLYFYEYFNNGNLLFKLRTTTGSELEADASYSVKFSPDGNTLLVSNSLSGSISVVDVDAEELQSIIPLANEEVYQADFTSDGKYVLAARRLANHVDVIDIETEQVIATVPSGGSKPDQVFVLPGDQKAFALNAGGADNIGVIFLNGANSSLATTFPSGNTGISWTNYGIRSGFEISPDEQFAVLAAPFDNEVKIIRLSDNAIVESMTMAEFPLQVAISDPIPGEGMYAAVTMKNNNIIGLIGNVGPDAELIGFYPCGANPTRIDYDPSTKRFAVCSNDNKTVEYFDIELQLFVDSDYFGPDYTPLAVKYDGAGNSYILLRADNDNLLDRLMINDEAFDIPALPIQNFDVAKDGSAVAVPLIAADQVFMVKRDPNGLHPSLVNTSVPQIYTVSPNPASDFLRFRLKDGVGLPGEEVQLDVLDVEGKLILQKMQLNPGAFEIPVVDLPGGNLFYRISGNVGILATGKVFVSH